jgi:hypothetical protein
MNDDSEGQVVGDVGHFAVEEPEIRGILCATAGLCI